MLLDKLASLKILVPSLKIYIYIYIPISRGKTAADLCSSKLNEIHKS